MDASPATASWGKINLVIASTIVVAGEFLPASKAGNLGTLQRTKIKVMFMGTADLAGSKARTQT